MALVMMDDEQQSAAAVKELNGKVTDPEGNLIPQVPEGPILPGRRPLQVEPAHREVMTNAEKVARLERVRALQKANSSAAQRRAEAAVQARLQEMRLKTQSLRDTVPEDERASVVTQHKFKVATSKFGTRRRDQCPRCWLIVEQCICLPPTPPAVLAAFPHRTLVYLHVKEYGRQSNTGALAAVAFPPPQSEVFVAGVREHEEAFRAALARDPARTLVLFPSAESVTIAEFLRTAAAAPPAPELPGGGGGAQPPPGCLTVVIVDGTWAQA